MKTVKFLKFLFLLMLIAVQENDAFAVTASRSLLSRAIVPIKSFTSIHPRLAATAGVVAITCGTLWILDKIINRPVPIPQAPVVYVEDNVAPDVVDQRNVKRETAFIFAHGWGGDCEQARAHLRKGTVFLTNDTYKGVQDQRFANPGTDDCTAVGFDCSCCAVNFPDAYRITDGNPSAGSSTTYYDCVVLRRQFLRSSIGQEPDVACLQKTYNDYVQRGGKHKNIVLYGASRGASTIINFMARSNLKHVKALVLESPFDSVPNCLRDVFLGRWAKIPGLHWFCHRFITKLLCRNYEPHGVQPLDVVDQIQADIPVLFVCSKTEPYYPATLRLYKKLVQKRREQGKNNVHLLVLEHGNHCALLYDRSAGLYRGVVHAFYDAYGLTHDATSREITVLTKQLSEAEQVFSTKETEVFQNVTYPIDDSTPQWKEYRQVKEQRDDLVVDLRLARDRLVQEQKDDQLGREFFAMKSRPDPDTLPF